MSLQRANVKAMERTMFVTLQLIESTPTLDGKKSCIEILSAVVDAYNVALTHFQSADM